MTQEQKIIEIVDMHLQPLEITGLSADEIHELEEQHDELVGRIATAIVKALSVPSEKGKIREKFFTECTNFIGGGDTLRKVNIAPHDLFEWFWDNLQSHSTTDISIKVKDTLNSAKMCILDAISDVQIKEVLRDCLDDINISLSLLEGTTGEGETKAIQKSDRSYNLACQNCGTTSKPLQMIPFRNDNNVVGLLTACNDCKDILYGQRFDREEKFSPPVKKEE